MRKTLLIGAALGLFALAAVPASAMPVAKIAPAVTNDEAGVVQVRYRRHYSRYSYRPRARYGYRNYSVRRSYGYYDGGPSYYSGYGGPSYYGGGYGGGYYGGGPSIGLSFGTGRW